MANDIWDSLEQTLEPAMVSPADTATQGDIWLALADQLNPAKFRPKPVADCELRGHVPASGEPYFVLTNPAGVYLKLTPAQAFIWETLDGKLTVRDLIVAYMVRFGELALSGVPQTLQMLLQHGFLERPKANAFEELQRRLRRRSVAVDLLLKLLKAFLSTTFSIRWVDPAYRWLYRAGARGLFSPFSLALLLAVTVLGLAAFGYLLQTRSYSIFTTDESLSLGMITLYCSMTLVALIHESGHALTCIHYGRRIRKGGAMIYIGMLAFYIDTTDIWMAPRRARIAVSLAGPFMNLVCGAVICLVLFALPDSSIAEVFFKVAATSFLLAAINLNPLLLLDGYFVLMDALEMPNLRGKAFAFLARNLRHPVRYWRHWLHLTRKEVILVVYGLVAALFTGVMIVVGLRSLALQAYNGLSLLIGRQLSAALLLSLAGALMAWLLMKQVMRRGRQLRAGLRVRRSIRRQHRRQSTAQLSAIAHQPKADER